MNDKRKQRCIKIARNLGDKKPGKSLHFSFILDKNKILIIAANDLTRRHPEHLFGKYLPTKGNETQYIPGVHSEIGALKNFLNKFGNLNTSGLTLFNIRLNSKGELLLAKPCQNCQKVLETLNFKNIIWT